MDKTYNGYRRGRSNHNNNPYFLDNNDTGHHEGYTPRSFYAQNGSRADHSRPNTAVARSNKPSKNIFFSGEGPFYRGDGRDTQFGKHRRPPHEMRPFSPAIPFTVAFGPAGKATSASIKDRFAAANPGVSGEGLYMDFIYRSWAQSPDRPLSQVHRSHGLKAMLQCGDVDQISAEVFHFLCGIHQCKYGDGFMRDDMVLCDCDGRVPRCFATAYIELARKVQYLEQKLEGYRTPRTSSSRPPKKESFERSSSSKDGMLMEIIE